MTIKLKWLLVIASITFLKYVWAIRKPPRSTGTTTPEPVTFPYGIECVSNNGWKHKQQTQTKDCCKEADAPCKKKFSHKQTNSNCVAQNHDERNKMIECCKRNSRVTWSRAYVINGEDC